MEATALAHARILLGVSGGIAAYKAADLVRRLRDAGAEVRVVMTAGATRFVTPLTFQALSGQPVRSGLWDENAEAAMGHIELARWADQILIAPASADCLAKLAHGLADDLLTTLCLASAAPLAVAPAMNQQMWAHAATQANLAVLRTRGVQVLGPGHGDQACGETGAGRMLEPTELVLGLVDARGPRPLAGLRLLVSAGPTYEDLDPVRFLGNRSSGKMGFALADAGIALGASVTLIAGPVALATPVGVIRQDVRSNAEMRVAILSAARQHDIFVSAAAVADYRPVEVATQKIKKSQDSWTLSLQRTADILAEVAALPDAPFLVGFAAETRDLERHAREKLANKRLDMIAANWVGGELGFESADNALSVFWSDGSETLPQAPKPILARRLLELIATRFGARKGRR